MSADPLPTELRDLGRSLEVTVTEDFTAAVMTRIEAEPAPRRRGTAWLARRWRALVGALTAVVLVGALTPPVRAAVAEWLGLGAVSVRTGTGAPPSSAPPPPTAAGGSLDQARSRAVFPIAVPARLGDPASVEVSADGRVVSMSWRDGAVRLDQVAGTLSPYFTKTVHGQVVFTTVRGAEALWLPGPHRLVVDSSGVERVEPPRLAGATLIWQTGDITLRLEGDLSRADAVAIAES
ncbi:hypothetical protein ACTG9Q_11770 [Actinokineospora sp. 24-640]